MSGASWDYYCKIRVPRLTEKTQNTETTTKNQNNQEYNAGNWFVYL